MSFIPMRWWTGQGQGVGDMAAGDTVAAQGVEDILLSDKLRNSVSHP